MRFTEFNFSPEVLEGIEASNYENATPVQEQVIPPIMSGKDEIASAQTGTGKTAAFALPVLNKLINHKTRGRREIKALILAPTRELALQIHESIEAYGRHTGIRSCVIFGGVSAKPQIEKLRKGVDILVATPGRLKDLESQKEINLKSLDIFVRDEADRMLDMGFIHDVKKIISMILKPGFSGSGFSRPSARC